MNFIVGTKKGLAGKKMSMTDIGNTKPLHKFIPTTWTGHYKTLHLLL